MPIWSAVNIEWSRGANMIRPMTSNVSALSGIVANGHQAIHFVSSAPSKIPYGGFSPGRLQTSCQQRPSWPSPTYTLPQFPCPPRAVYSVVGLAPGGTRGFDFIHPSSGPWLPRRLYCPAGCLLWPLLRLCQPPNDLWIISSGCGTSPPAAEGPQFTLSVRSPHAVARTPVASAIAFNDVFIADSVFAKLAAARRPLIPRIRIKWAA
jgi:hypothetical protein